MQAKKGWANREEGGAEEGEGKEQAVGNIEMNTGRSRRTVLQEQERGRQSHTTILHKTGQQGI